MPSGPCTRRRPRSNRGPRWRSRAPSGALDSADHASVVRPGSQRARRAAGGSASASGGCAGPAHPSRSAARARAAPGHRCRGRRVASPPRSARAARWALPTSRGEAPARGSCSRCRRRRRARAQGPAARRPDAGHSGTRRRDRTPAAGCERVADQAQPLGEAIADHDQLRRRDDATRATQVAGQHAAQPCRAARIPRPQVCVGGDLQRLAQPIHLGRSVAPRVRDAPHHLGCLGNHPSLRKAASSASRASAARRRVNSAASSSPARLCAWPAQRLMTSASPFLRACARSGEVRWWTSG
jgi:hypothetical protein